MLRRFVGPFAAAIACAPSIAAPPLKVPPGKWAIDYAKEYCVLSRDGVGGEPGVAFRTRPLALRHDLLIYMSKTNAPRVTRTGRLVVGDGQLGLPRFVEEVEPPKKTHRFINTMISKDEFEAVAGGGSIRIVDDKGYDLRVSIPQMSRAFAALRDCEDDLARRWGLNPEYVRNWKTPPKPKQSWSKVVHERDWPDWSRDYGRNKASFIVDESGRATDCKIGESSGSKKMDKALCDGVLRMTFDPALDAERRPVRSAQMFGTYWMMIWTTRYEFMPR